MIKGGTSERTKWFVCGGIIIAALTAYLWWYFLYAARNVTVNHQDNFKPAASMSAPQINVETLVSGRSHIWEIAFLPDGTMLFSERDGTLQRWQKDGNVQKIASIADVRAKGEGGLMGLAVDPEFANNRYIYACFNSAKSDIRVARWRLTEAYTLTNRTDIISGIEANPSGRHSGCRLAFGGDNYLWITTGDAAKGGVSQSQRSLNGKILRIDRTGKAAPDNIGGVFDARIYSYGHRNPQGIAFFKEPRAGVLGFSAEHGSYIDDELNILKTGNFGWAPPAGQYTEQNVPMTDTQAFPDAHLAAWKSGTPTEAPGGIALLQGSAWQGWEYAVAMAMLKAEHLKILRLDAQNSVVGEEKILLNHGRLRAVTQGSDGALYVGTSNGSNDEILRVTPE